MNNHQAIELTKCNQDLGYFVDSYCRIYDSAAADWIPFHLWSDQRQTLDTIREKRLVCILKARQLGLTWLCLAFVLHRMLFRPKQTILLFSRRDDESIDLLGNRLHGMYDRLPPWMQVESFPTDHKHVWELSNGSRCMAFPTTSGDSYTATLAIVDEADLVPDLDRLMRSVKPTIDAGGKMILLSRSDKSKPMSAFKRIYEGAKSGKTGWVSVFLPWHSRPDRDAAWYEAQRQDVLARTGALDDLAEQVFD